jgi:amino acid adenylation domain-containing protein
MADLIQRLSRLPGDRRAAFLAKLRSGTASAVPPLARRVHEAPPPVSYGQETIWFVDRLAPGRATYNVSTGYWLRGRLDVPALAGALAEVVARHEALRTALRDKGDGPVQEIAEHLEVTLPVSDVTGASVEAVRALAVAEGRLPFDLSRHPLWRLRLLRLAGDEHLLVVVVHHVIYDGWSMGVFARDLAAAYARLTGHEAPDRPAPVVQYPDYAMWQRDWLAGPRGAELVEFWRRRLAGAPVLAFPTDRPRPPEITYDGGAQRMRLPARLATRVQRLARAEGVTANTVLTAAFLAFLQRYTGQDDLVIGSPTANRGQVEVEDLIGYFVNLMVIRADLSGDPDTRQLLARVGRTMSDAVAHGELPFERLVHALRPARDPSRPPFFQIAFAYQNAGDPLSLPGLEVREESLEPGTSRFDFSWNVTETAGGLELYVEYNTDLFDAETIAQHLRHYVRLLTGMLDDPTLPISRLPMLDAAERAELIALGSGPDRPVPEGTIVDLFAERVRRAPDATAVVVGGDSLTYAELDERTDRLAAALRAAGAAPGALVAVCLPRSPDLIVAVLAVLKSGAGYVPVDATYPPARIATILDDAAPVAVFSITDLTDRLPSHGPRRLLLDQPLATPPAAQSRPEPGDIAYVIYTSGTTGRPKGVLIEHAAVVNFIAAMQELFSLTPADRVLGFASINFDVSVFEIFSALLTGASLYLAREDERLDPRALQRLMEDAQISVVDIPPAVLALLDPDRLSALRIAFIGCELYPGNLVERWNRGRRFFNGYGPTECTVTMVVQECVGASWPVSPPIGLPIANHVAHVVDRRLEPVPHGVAGELVVGGLGLTPGYLNAPELTAAKIIPDPFGTAPGGRLYRTGDLVLRQRCGAIVFLGRIDQQVKIRGRRIELGEIEAILATHPRVGPVVVDVHTDAAGDRQLVAYYTRAADPVPTPAELREHLAAQLPGWMVPTYYVPLAALPLNGSGKVDRRALPAPGSDARPTTSTAQPTTPTERILAEEIFAPVLGLPSVGVDDGFFALGGHSLQATHLLSRIRTTFGVEIGLAAFLRAPTVAALAALVDRGQAAALDDDSMLALIERMSDEAAAKLLAADQADSRYS